MWTEASKKRLESSENKRKQLKSAIDKLSHIRQVEDLTKKELESVKVSIPYTLPFLTF